MDTYTDIYNTHTCINTTQLQYAQYLNECTVLLYEMSGCNVHVNEWCVCVSPQGRLEHVHCYRVH